MTALDVLGLLLFCGVVCLVSTVACFYLYRLDEHTEPGTTCSRCGAAFPDDLSHRRLFHEARSIGPEDQSGWH